MRVRKHIKTALFLFWLMLPLVALAQGRLVGKVTDQNNAPVVAAVVSISSQELNEAAITNASGYYVFYSLPPGDYKVKVIKRGLPSIQSGVALVSGITRLLDIKLTPQAPQKEVVVAVEAPKKVLEKRKVEPQPIKKPEAKEIVKVAKVGPVPPSEEPAKSANLPAVTTAIIDTNTIEVDVRKALSEAKMIADLETSQYDSPPEIAGGMNKLYQKLVYPSLAREKGLQGNVVAKVFVDQNGHVSKVSLVKKSDEMFNDEVYRVLTEDMRFIPAVRANKPVAVATTVFVTFSLQKNALGLQVQAAVLSKIFAEEKGLRQKNQVRVGVVYSSPEEKASATEMQTAFSSVKLAAKVLEEKELRQAVNDFDVLYLMSDVNFSAIQRVAENSKLLTVTSNSRLVEDGFVSLAVTNDEQGRPKIFINQRRLEREDKSFSGSILKLSTVIE